MSCVHDTCGSMLVSWLHSFLVVPSPTPAVAHQALAFSSLAVRQYRVCLAFASFSLALLMATATAQPQGEYSKNSLYCVCLQLMWGIVAGIRSYADLANAPATPVASTPQPSTAPLPQIPPEQQEKRTVVVVDTGAIIAGVRLEKLSKELWTVTQVCWLPHCDLVVQCRIYGEMIG